MRGDSVGAMDALTTAMLQFGVDLNNPSEAAQKMTTMMNIMAAGAKEGAAEVPDIASALKNAGVEALNANVSFGETNAALQALAQGGKVGADAGIALRNVITRMQGIDIVPKRAREMLKELGVNYDIVSNKTLPFTTRLRELSKAQGDATLVAEIFGVENSAAANILLRSTQYQDDMKNKILGTNTATEQANTVMSSYRETMAKVSEWFKDLGISFFSVGKYIAPFVTGIAGTIVVLANLANAKTGVTMLFSALKTMPSISAIVSGGFTAMSTAAKGFGVAIMNIPIIGWIAAIIAGLVAVGIYLYKTSATFRGIFMGIWEVIKTVFTGIYKFTMSVLEAIWHVIRRVFNPKSWFDKNDNLSDSFKNIVNVAKTAGENISKAYGIGRDKGIADFNKDKKNQTSSAVTSGGLDIKNTNPLLSTKSLSKSGETKGLGSGGSSIKNITQKIEIKNYFSLSNSAGNSELDGIAEKVVRAINDKLRDAVVAAS